MDYFEQETERLFLRKINQHDIDSWAEFFIDNPGLKYLAIDGNDNPYDLSKKWINNQLERYYHNEYGLLAAIRKKDNQLIGMGGILIQTVDGTREHEIAYSIKPSYWNKGYATEIARQIKKYVREHKISDRVISIIDKDNIASIEVAKKNGMTLLFETEFFNLEVYVYGSGV